MRGRVVVFGGALSFDITIGGHDREWTVVDVC